MEGTATLPPPELTQDELTLATDVSNDLNSGVEEDDDELSLSDEYESADNRSDTSADEASSEDEEVLLEEASKEFISLYSQAGQENEDDAWWPWPSKIMFFLDYLEHTPRARFSDRMMKLIIWLLKKCDVNGVPSLKELRTCQKHLQDKHGVKTLAIGQEGKKDLHVNDPREIIAKDWSNPLIRGNLQLYPDINESKVFSEIWHGTKWTDSKFSPPMWENRKTGASFYVGEVCSDGERFWEPLRWWQNNQLQYFADVLPLELSQLVCLRQGRQL